MKTIFDYNPSQEELIEALGFDSFLVRGRLGVVGVVTEEIYLSKISEDDALFDIGLLLEYRNEDASEIWKLIPEKYEEYMRGFDYEIIPV